MAERRFAANLPPIFAASLLAAGLLAGCNGMQAQQADMLEGPEDLKVYQTGYPFRPAHQYKIDDLDELSGPTGYTAGY